MKSRKIIRDALIVAVFAFILFVPSAKAFFLNGLMRVGFFQPSLKALPTAAVSAGQTPIKFKDKAGHIVDLRQLEGKVVFVNIWATWCPPCLAELPNINRLYQRYQSDINVAFLMVDADGDLKKSASLFNGKGYQMPLYELYTELPTSWFDGTVPTTLVFDKRGKLALRQVGATNYNADKFVNFIENLKSK